jgi:hypothetical protein
MLSLSLSNPPHCLLPWNALLVFSFHSASSRLHLNHFYIFRRDNMYVSRTHESTTRVIISTEYWSQIFHFSWQTFSHFPSSSTNTISKIWLSATVLCLSNWQKRDFFFVLNSAITHTETWENHPERIQDQKLHSLQTHQHIRLVPSHLLCWAW